MQAFLAVAAGGAIGAMLRYGVGLAMVGRGLAGLPWATLLVNVVGSALMGLLLVLLTERWPDQTALRLFLTTGLFGALTTFSTFSVETLDLLLNQRHGAALAYAFGSLLLCVTAAAAGLGLGRYLLKL